MGTTGAIKTRGAAPPPGVAQIASHLDRIFSHWRVYNPLTAFNATQAGTPFEAPPELLDIVALAETLRRQTDGAFDITAGSRPGVVAIDLAEGTMSRPHPETRIDLSAIAKGYAIDRMAEALEESGIADYLIEFGGELRAGPGGRWTVGIESPTGGKPLREIALQGESVATSGTYRLGDHIVDPASGVTAARGLVSASVIAPTAAVADALATAAIVSGGAPGEALLVYADGREKGSGRFAR